MISCRRLFGLLLIIAALFTGCGPSTFLLGRQGTTVYFGREHSYFHRLLCVQGEFKQVLEDSGLPVDVKNDFLQYVCSNEPSYDKVVSLYLFLTPDEKKQLKSAFEKHGYEVNHLNC